MSKERPNEERSESLSSVARGQAEPELFRSEISVREINVEKRTIDFIASTDAVDSYGEIVEQVWDFSRFKKNPTILYAHNRHSDGGWLESPSDPKFSLPIGRATDWGVVESPEGKALHITVEFSTPDLNDWADQVFRNAAAGFIKAGSVGFKPHSVRTEIENDVERYILSDNELYEFSICPMGANPDAVALSLDSRAKHRQRLAQLASSQKDKPMPETKSETVAAATQEASEIKRLTEERDAALSALRAKEAELTTTSAELVEAKKSLADAEKRASDLDAELVQMDVDAYIGKKLVPSERDTAVEDRKRDGKAKFAARMAARPELGLTKSTIEADTKAREINVVPGAKLASRVDAEAGRA